MPTGPCAKPSFRSVRGVGSNRARYPFGIVAVRPSVRPHVDYSTGRRGDPDKRAVRREDCGYAERSVSDPLVDGTAGEAVTVFACANARANALNAASHKW